jgi:hypothetical protein
MLKTTTSLSTATAPVTSRRCFFFVAATFALFFASWNKYHASVGMTVSAFVLSGSFSRPISRTVLLLRGETTSRSVHKPTSSSFTTTSLNSMGDDWFNGFKKFFGGTEDDKNDDVIPMKFTSSPSSSSPPKYYEDDFELEDDDLPAGTTLLLSISAKQLKPGGLRLFLMFYLMGMQNTPHPQAWKACQPTTSGSDEDDDNKHVLEMYFHDATGMIQIEMISRNDSDEEATNKYQVRLLRCGSVPSTAYLMQESLIVDGILDELQQCAFDGSVAPTDRLLIPEPTTAIEDARQALAFR